MKPTNESIAAVLRRLVQYTQLEEGKSQSFRTRAYERAIEAISASPDDIADLTVGELKAIEGIGDSTARKIVEFVERGAIGKLERLEERFPVTMLELMRIPGLGPKTVLLLRDQLGVVDVAGLEQAIEREQLRTLPGLGVKSEQKIADAIAMLGIHSDETRIPIHDAMAVAERVIAALRDLEGIDEITYAGSLRRLSETIGDVDVLVAASDAGPIVEAFTSLPDVTAILGSGATKVSVVIDHSVQVDLRVVPPEAFGAALLYFTGSKSHNIELRQRALDRDLTLNEYALTRLESGSVVASETESDVYGALDLPWITPEVREGTGEIAAAADGSLPAPVTVDDIRGDLHVHTDWSGDGRASLHDMLTAVVDRGLAYVLITDHGEDLVMNGLSRERMIEQRHTIDGVRDEFGDLRILHGAELNIAKDGSVDYDPEFLATFDATVASVHSHFDLDEAEQTKRLLRAIANPFVTILGHLTGRKIGHRPGIRFDVDDVFAAAAETGTILEINSSLHRLDVPAPLLRRAASIDRLRFSISTDAHRVRELDNARWGAAQARKGWIPKDRIINTLPFDELSSIVRSIRNETRDGGVPSA